MIFILFRLFHIFSQEAAFFFRSNRTTCYVLEKQPRGLLYSKWKLHECCITFTSSHEYLKAYSVVLQNTWPFEKKTSIYVEDKSQHFENYTCGLSVHPDSLP